MMKIYDNPGPKQWEALTARNAIQAEPVGEWVSAIIKRVRTEGDAALYDFSRAIDGVELTALQVSEMEIDAACARVEPAIQEAVKTARENIARFHEAQRMQPVEVETMPGVRCRQRAVPIERVGLYVPGGSAPLFSTVLMLAVPAAIAGCRHVVLCTPPDKSGRVNDVILFAARLCGVTHIYKVGGAQAIAAMAYGTESIPKVDKVFGPGNRYVTEAKQQVSRTQVAIDMPAGPSEVLVMADETANPEFSAADLLSQAEHGGDSQVILVASSLSFAEQVEACVERQMKTLSRESIVERALEHSRIVVLDSRKAMTDFANQYAAEHLIISMRNPWEIVDNITAAGSVFVGNYTPESAGDYASGTNHTLPTYGWARSCSGVNLDSFLKKITIQEITPDGLRGIGSIVETMAQAEGLSAHRNAVSVRLKTLNENE